MPEFAPLIEQARANPDKPASGEIHIARDGQRRTFSVRVAQARLGDGTLGLVATFDDVTDLEAGPAQSRVVGRGAAHRA